MKKIKDFISDTVNSALRFNIRLFDAPDYNVQTTLLNSAGNDLSPEMKTYYSKYLIETVDPYLVHDQFAQKENIPQGNGKTIEFRRFASLPKALKPLVEGVTPKGNKLNVTAITSEVHQYGDYITTSDILELTSIDKVIVQETKILGSQAGRTLDTVTREVLAGGTNVLYADNVNGDTVTTTSARHLLNENCKMTPDMSFQAKANLSANNAPKIDDSYVCIIHPYAAYDLMRSDEWIDLSKYNSDNYYKGEIGKIGGVRYVETTEAKIFCGDDLSAQSRNLTSTTVSAGSDGTSATVTVSDTLEENELIDRYIISNSKQFKITANTASTITVVDPDGGKVTASDLSSKTIYPGEGGADGLAVFSCLVLGDNAYGTTEIEGGGLQHIYKPLGSAGSADPLNQRGTVGWKATKTAERLVEEYMLRVECCSKYSSSAKAN